MLASQSKPTTANNNKRFSIDLLDVSVLSSKDAFLEMVVSNSPPNPNSPCKHELDSDIDDEPKRKQQDTQSLADFLRTTGPAMPSPTRKKLGIFKSFGGGPKKKGGSSKFAVSIPKYVPLTVAAGYLPEAPNPRIASNPNNISGQTNINSQLLLRQKQFLNPDQTRQEILSSEMQPQIRQELSSSQSAQSVQSPQFPDYPVQNTQKLSSAPIMKLSERGQSLGIHAFMPVLSNASDTATQSIVHASHIPTANNISPLPSTTNVALSSPSLSMIQIEDPSMDYILPVQTISTQDYTINAAQKDDLYSEDGDEALGDQGMDEAIECNTEYNAVIENFAISEADHALDSATPKTRKTFAKSVIFAILDDNIGNASIDDNSTSENNLDDSSTSVPVKAKVKGRGNRGSYYPRGSTGKSSSTAGKVSYTKRQSSLGCDSRDAKTNLEILGIEDINLISKEKLSSPPPSSSVVDLVKEAPAIPQTIQPTTALRKKKIRHVQIQTRVAQGKDFTQQTTQSSSSSSPPPFQPSLSPPVPSKDPSDAANALLTRRNAHLEQTIASLTRDLETSTSKQINTSQELDDNRIKFDKLSAQAYKKIKELLLERKMLDVELSTLRDQVTGIQNAQMRQWLDPEYEG